MFGKFEKLDHKKPTGYIPGLNTVAVVRHTPVGEFKIRWVKSETGYMLNICVPPNVVMDWNYEHIPR